MVLEVRLLLLLLRRVVHTWAAWRKRAFTVPYPPNRGVWGWEVVSASSVGRRCHAVWQLQRRHHVRPGAHWPKGTIRPLLLHGAWLLPLLLLLLLLGAWLLSLHATHGTRGRRGPCPHPRGRAGHPGHGGGQRPQALCCWRRGWQLRGCGLSVRAIITTPPGLALPGRSRLRLPSLRWPLLRQLLLLLLRLLRRRQHPRPGPQQWMQGT